MIKTVITAAGRGMRLFPATKSLPKEMLPIFSKSNGTILLTPLLQYIFEQTYALKLRNYCFVVGRDKNSIKNHFMTNSRFNNVSINNQKSIKEFNKKLKNSRISWVTQNNPLGFGDAVRKTEKYVGKSNMIVHAGDVTFISSHPHPVSRMINVTKNDSSVSCVLLCKKVKDTKRYGVVTIKKISNNLFSVNEVEEKPNKPKSKYAIMPIYFFKPKIFDCLKKIKKGKNGEYQLTDAIQRLIDDGEKVMSIPLLSNEIEIDVGTAELYKKSLDFSYKWKRSE